MLYGDTWVQDDEPTVGLVAGMRWFTLTSGEKWQRDSSNSQWIFKGYVNEPYDGCTPMAGAVAMTGAIEGVPGFSPIFAPNYPGIPQIGGVNIATMLDLETLRSEIKGKINSAIDSSFGAAPTTSLVLKSVAANSGDVFLTFAQAHAAGGFTVPAPIFKSDGAVASDNQIVMSWCALNTVGSQSGGNGGYNDIYMLNTKKLAPRTWRMISSMPYNTSGVPPTTATSIDVDNQTQQSIDFGATQLYSFRYFNLAVR